MSRGDVALLVGGVLFAAALLSCLYGYWVLASVFFAFVGGSLALAGEWDR